MQKLLFVLSISFISIFSYSQSHTPGTLNFSLSYDVGAHLVLYDSKFDNGTLSFESEQDSSGAATSLFRFDAHFNILERLSVGLNYRTGQYIEDPDNTQAIGNKINVVGLNVRYYLVNKNKFAMYLGGAFGSSKLVMNRQTDPIFNTVILFDYKFSGSHYGLETGFNFYFSNNFGMNVGLGYASQKFKMKEHTFNGVDQDLTNYENILSSKGATFNIGLTFKLGGK